MEVLGFRDAGGLSWEEAFSYAATMLRGGVVGQLLD
jgi:hypothetical protein